MKGDKDYSIAVLNNFECYDEDFFWFKIKKGNSGIDRLLMLRKEFQKFQDLLPSQGSIIAGYGCTGCKDISTTTTDGTEHWFEKHFVPNADGRVLVPNRDIIKKSIYEILMAFGIGAFSKFRNIKFCGY